VHPLAIKNSIKSMLIPYKKQYVRFARVEEAGRTLVYAVLLENNGREEVALSEPQLVRVMLKAGAAVLALPAGHHRLTFSASPILSPFAQVFFFEYEIPHFSYAQPPTI